MTFGITHTFGPWSPMRFLALPFQMEGDTPSFIISTSRMCRGTHDWRCTQAETMTFGPLTLTGASWEQVFRCDNCGRLQPPADTAMSTSDEQRCLFCTDMATVQHTGDSRDTTAALTAAAALHAASATLRTAKDADPTGYVALLDDTGDALRSLMDDAAWAVKQDPQRAGQAGYRAITLIARQVTANAREYAKLTEEPLPVKETDSE